MRVLNLSQSIIEITTFDLQRIFFRMIALKINAVHANVSFSA